MARHVEEFGVATSTTATVDACRRALRSHEWDEQTSDLFVVRLLDDQSRDLADIVEVLRDRVPITRWFINRYAYRSMHAPEGPPGPDAEIIATRRRGIVIRISLRDRGTSGTGVTISGSDVGALPWAGPLRSAIGDLRQSIQTQSAVV